MAKEQELKSDFDKEKEYGYYSVVTDVSAMPALRDAINENAMAAIPRELMLYVHEVISHCDACSITVSADNFEQLGEKVEDIGQVLEMPEHWTAGWIYQKRLDVESIGTNG